jgi:hypothetical protein
MGQHRKNNVFSRISFYTITHLTPNADKGIYLYFKTAGAITGIVGFLLNSSEGQLFWVRGAWQGCDRRVSLILPRLGL